MLAFFCLEQRIEGSALHHARPIKQSEVLQEVRVLSKSTSKCFRKAFTTPPTPIISLQSDPRALFTVSAGAWKG
jgi:hypothetical protein